MSRFSKSLNQGGTNAGMSRRVLRRAVESTLERLEERRMFALPVADAGGPYTVAEGGTVLINGLGSTDDGSIVSYQWDTNYSAGRGFRARFTGTKWNFTASDSGTRNIALRVTDNDGGQHTVTQTITITDVAPTISLTAPNNTAEGQDFNISWSYADPGQSDAVTAWEVDWGDGQVSTLAGNATGATHAFSEDGTYNIILTATQTDGQTSVNHNIVVDNEVPQVNASTTTPEIDENQSVNVSFSSPNRGTTIEGWSIDWGDGNIDVLPRNATGYTHTYTDNGTYTAIVTAMEPDGGVNGSATVQYSVANLPPTIAITGTPASEDEGNAITVGSTVNDPSGDDTHIYGWTVYRNGQSFALPGGTVINNTNFTFTPTDNGTYVIRLTVVDDDGASVTVNSDPITVNNVNPTANITGAPVGNIDEGTAVNLTVTPADAGDEDTFTYAWTVTKDGLLYTLPNGTDTESATFSFTPDDNGSYVAICVVTDDDGGDVQVTTAAITVDNAAPVGGINGVPVGQPDEGDNIPLSASVTDAGAADTHTYLWSVEKDGNPFALPGGAVVDEANFAFVPTDNGSYVVTLVVTDDDGGTDTVTSAPIVVNNLPPIPEIDGATTAAEGDTVSLTSDLLDRGSADTHTYAWSVEKDGQAFVLPGGTVTNGTSFAFEPTDNGTYVVSLTVTDDDGDDATVTHTITVSNVAPVVQQDNVPASGDEGDAITIGSTVSDAGDDDTLTYGWTVYRDGQHFTLPGGTDITNTSFTFTPTDDGSYVVRLSVLDDDGDITTVDSDPIVIDNVNPTASISGEPVGNINEGDAVNLTVTPADAGDEDTFTYSWSVTRNGSAYTLPNNVDTTSANFSFHPLDNGTFVATVVVTDDDGGDVQVASVAIVVDNVAPSASVIDEPVGNVNEGSEISANAFYTDPGEEDTFTFAWSVEKDGQPFALPGGLDTTSSHFAFVPTDNGTYVLTLTVTDDDGGTHTVTGGNITVVNVAPTAVVTGDDDGTEGHTVNYSVAVTDPSVDTHTYAWSVEKDGQAFVLPGGLDTASSTFAFVPTDNGAYVVTVVVTDDDGGANTYTHNLTVTNLAPNIAINGAPANEDEGNAINLTSTLTDSGTLDTHSYAWSVTKNGQAYGAGALSTYSFTPDDDGTYVITLVATDNDGDSTTTTETVEVANLAPTISVSGEPVGNINEGVQVDLTTNLTEPGTDDTHVYSWAVTKDGVAYATGVAMDGNTLSFIPRDNGTYVATVTVTDDDGGVGTISSTNIVVDNVAPVASIDNMPVGNVNEGTSIGVDAGVTDAGADDTHTYAWSVTKNGQPFALPGGVATDEASFTFVPTDNGSYEITLTVTDDDAGTTTITSAAITVDNVAPTGVLTGDTTAEEGDTANFALALTDPGSADTHTYLWSVEKDGQAFVLPGGTDVASSTFAFVPTDNGAYVVSVVVTDDDAGTNTYTHNLSVSNADPSVVIAGNTSADEGDTVSLTSTVTDAGADDTHTYSWSVEKDGVAFVLPGGTDTTSATFDFVPTDEGSYVVTVVVTDDDGATGTDTHTVTVANVDPVAAITGAPVGSVNEGDPVSLGSTATDAGSTDVLHYAWSVSKDGSSYTLPGGTVTDQANFTFTPRDNGSYVVTLVVTDEDGGIDTVATAAITVDNVAPVGAITGTPVGNPDEGDTVSLGSTVTDAGEDDTHTYAWSVEKDGNPFALPGGTVTNASRFNFVPTDNGSYVVTLVVTDDDGDIDTVVSAPIVVDNVAPAPVISGNASVNEASAITLTVDPHDTGAADTHTYAWSVEKDGQPYVLPGGVVTNGSSFTFTPSRHGSYVVSVTVTDDDGASTTTTHNLTVNNLPPVVNITGLPSGVRAEGYGFNLNSTAVDPGGDNVLTYAWSVTRGGQAFTLPGGTVTNASTFSFEATDNGTYVIHLSVTDSGGATGTAHSSNILITNALPNGVMNNVPGAPVTENTPITVDVDASDPGAEDTLTYLWTVTKNGSAYTLPGGTVTDGTNFTFTPTDNGTYVVNVAVRDDDNGVTNVSSGAITVDNAAPTASITGEPGQAELEGLLVQLGSSVVDASPLDTFTYAWTVTKDGQAFTLPGGTTTNDTTFNFTATDNGTYTVHLTVTDDDGGSVSVDSDPIVVTNAAPTGTISGPASVVEGATVSLTTSITDAGSADTHTYAWTVTKDGQAFALPGGTVTNASALSFVPTDNGAYVATCVVTDDDGGTVTLTHNVAATNAAPTVTIAGATSATEGDTVSLTSTLADAGSADTHTYAWTVTKDGQAFALPGGTDTASSTFSFVPTDEGSYVVTLTVTDDDTATGTDTHTITVANANPTASITGTPVGSVNEGSAISLGSTSADVGATDVLHYAWSVTKNGSAFALPGGTVTDASSFTFTPTDNGNYVVTLVVSDEDGGSVSVSTAAIGVVNVAPTASVDGEPANAVEGDTVSVTSTVADAGSADTHSYAWSVTKNGSAFTLPGGTVTNASTFAFVPTDNGTYVVSLTVTDDDTGTVTVTSDNITVTNANPTGSITGATTAVEGSSVALTASVSDAGSADTHSYAWSVTKNGVDYGVSGTSSSFSFTPDDNGTYIATCVVTDDDGGTVTLTHTVAATNAAPTASIAGPTTGDEASQLDYTVTPSDAGSADTHSYAWSVTKNGVDYGVSGTASSFSFTPDDNGTYVVSCVVTDDDNGAVTATKTVTVANVNPVATITNAPVGNVTEGTPVTLNSSASDVGDDTLSYTWSVTKNGSAYTPNGLVTDQASFTFTPNDNGTYVVTLVVHDEDGGAVTASTATVTVVNEAPVASIPTSPTTGVEGTSIGFVGGLTDAGSADTHTYLWTVTKDGQPYSVSGNTASTFSFMPNDNGTYVVTLTVTDDDGTVDSETSANVVVSNANPTGSISGPTSGNEGSAVTLTASASDVGSADTHTYLWSVTKNGQAYDLGSATVNAASLTFTPDDDASYVATCVVTDDDGGTATLTKTVTVANVNPTIGITGAPTTGDEGAEISVGSTVTDPGTETYTYGWTIRKDGVAIYPVGVVLNGETLTFTPSDNGTYKLRLTVLDGDGGSTSLDTANIVVSNVDPAPVITGAPTNSDEGEPITLGSTVTDAGADDETAGFDYLWTVTRGSTEIATGTEANFTFTPGVHGEYTVTLRATDKDNGETTTSATTITVDNVAPSDVVITGMPESMDESEVVTLTGSASDAPDDVVSYNWSVKRNGTDFAGYQGPEFAFSPHARGDFEVTLVATDSSGATTSETQTIHVDNLAPEATATATSETLLLGETANFGLSFTDVPPSQEYVVTWNFGDGTVVTENYTGNQSGLTKTHVYANAGAFNVTITVNDGVDATVINKTVNVSRAAVRTSPFDATKTALYVLGTSGADNILVEPGTGAGKVKVTLNGVVLGTEFAPTGSTYIQGNNGNDNITVTGSINSVVKVGAQSSVVSTGAGNDMIIGSPQADILNGGGGRDIVIGGAGKDSLLGGDSEDLLVADSVAWASSFATIKSVRDLWNHPTNTLSARVTQAKATGLFSGSNLIGDAVQDQLYGEGRGDWFVLNTSIDRLRDFVVGTDLMN